MDHAGRVVAEIATATFPECPLPVLSDKHEGLEDGRENHADQDGEVSYRRPPFVHGGSGAVGTGRVIQLRPACGATTSGGPERIERQRPVVEDELLVVEGDDGPLGQSGDENRRAGNELHIAQ